MIRMRSLVLLLVVALRASSARADAVPPPPTDCPPGKVGTTSHGGAHCVDAPPKNCPPGWRGVAGGNCMVAVCGADNQCDPGQVCRDQSLCMAEETEYYRGPPPEHPHVFDVPVGICVEHAVCNARCKPGKVCLRPGDTPSGTLNDTTARAPRGCGGCATLGGGAPYGLLVLGAVGVLAGLARRRRATGPSARGPR
jgi:hypothetical protein